MNDEYKFSDEEIHDFVKYLYINEHDIPDMSNEEIDLKIKNLVYNMTLIKKWIYSWIDRVGFDTIKNAMDMVCDSDKVKINITGRTLNNTPLWKIDEYCCQIQEMKPQTVDQRYSKCKNFCLMNEACESMPCTFFDLINMLIVSNTWDSVKNKDIMDIAFQCEMNQINDSQFCPLVGKTCAEHKAEHGKCCYCPLNIDFASLVWSLTEDEIELTDWYGVDEDDEDEDEDLNEEEEIEDETSEEAEEDLKEDGGEQ